MGDSERTPPAPRGPTPGARFTVGESSGLILRNARAADMEGLHRITTKAYREFEQTMEPEAWHGLDRAIGNAFARPSPVAHRIVAEQEGRLVGGVWLFPADTDAYSGAIPPLPWPEVRLLAVDTEARGRGVARSLMEECIRRVKVDGALRIGIHTSASMNAARRMYSKMGFKRFPQYDFQPPTAELVEAYVLELSGG